MNTRRNFNLYEITNGQVGESYVRCYAWAEDEYQAILGAAHLNENFSVERSQAHLLFDGNCGFSFVTQASDSGFSTIQPNPIAPQCKAATS